MLLENRVACVYDQTIGAADTARICKNSARQEMTSVLAHLRLLRVDLRRYTGSELYEGPSRERARHARLGENGIGCSVIEHTHDYQRAGRYCLGRCSCERCSLAHQRGRARAGSIPHRNAMTAPNEG